MGSVDKADFYCAIYGLNRKNVEWWHYLFFGLIHRALTNAFITYKKVSEDHITSLQFCRNGTMGLFTLGRPSKVGRLLTVSDVICLQNCGVRWVEFGYEQSRCEVCTQNKLEARPYSFFHTFKVALCSEREKNCFAVFHNL